MVLLSLIPAREAAAAGLCGDQRDDEVIVVEVGMRRRTKKPSFTQKDEADNMTDKSGGRPRRGGMTKQERRRYPRNGNRPSGACLGRRQQADFFLGHGL